MKYGNVAYYPFSLSIENSDAFIKFYMGDLFILVIIDPTIIHKKFAAKGLAVTINEAGDYALTITAIHKSGDMPRFLNIGKHMFWRVPFEFMSLNWLMDEFIYRFLNFSKSSAS